MGATRASLREEMGATDSGVFLRATSEVREISYRRRNKVPGRRVPKHGICIAQVFGYGWKVGIAINVECLQRMRRKWSERFVHDDVSV